MNNLKVGTRLALGFGAVVAVMALLCGLAAVSISNLSDQISVLAGRRLPNVLVAGKFSTAVLQSARHTRNMLILDDPAKIQAEVESLARQAALRTEYLATLDKNVLTPVNRVQLEKVRAAREAYLPLEKKYVALVSEGKMAQAKAELLGEMRPAQLVYLAELETLAAKIGENALKGGQETVADAAFMLKMVACGMVVALALAAVIAWLAARSIVRPLREAVGVADRIAGGNLRGDIALAGRDEISLLMRALSGMQGSLATLVRQIQAKSAAVGSASAELAATATQVASATASQSEAAAAMAASVEEMTVSVSHITDSAHHASTRTAESAELARSGCEVVGNAGNEVNAIASGIERSAELVGVLKTQSQEISSIANTIKGIAEQTNLLALNAAIEAARAGEQGRGFAVVADAVRNLAERTAQSTEEISGTIDKIQASTEEVFHGMNESVERARAGLALSQEAGNTINHLSSSAGEVLTAVREISDALKEQSQASNDIARHVESIAQMAQENSSAVEQANASATGLGQLAGELQEAASRFTV
jgi:methyl-accepting chemotaxis protein